MSKIVAPLKNMEALCGRSSRTQGRTGWVDESQDESKKEQMAIVVRFVDRNGYIKERFLDLVHVKDTNALTLINGILASLSHLKLDLDGDPELKNVSSLSALCRGLQKTKKSEMYPLIDRLIRLILTLLVSTATSERAFSKMKLVKTRLRSTMSDDFLKSSFDS
ncbi:zinc finger MYM-type protein 1-like protein [Tanacetum coccineum]